MSNNDKPTTPHRAVRQYVSMTKKLVLLMSLVTVGTVRGNSPGHDPAGVEPDPAVQSAIAAFTNAETEVERGQSLDRLKAMAEQSCQRLVLQLIFYSSSADNVKDAMACGIIVRHLAIPDRAVIEAIIPLLDAEDPALTKSSRTLLPGFEKRSAGRRPDFSAYRDIVSARLRAGEGPSMGLIRYLYQTDPGEALLTLMRAHQLREPDDIKAILWAEHVVSDTLWKQRYGFLGANEIEPAAVQELVKLSRYEQWWVRLYAAEITRQHAAFRQPELMNQLQNDDHRLVKSAALKAEKPDSE